jgi:hypothetical protein
VNSKKIWTISFLIITILMLMGCSTNSSVRSSNLVYGAVSIKPGSAYQVSFSVTDKMSNAQIAGTFNVRVGVGNNIEVFILNQTDYHNWSNGTELSQNVLYNSGRVTRADIKVSVAAAGTYYLIFSNRFSSTSLKQVITDVNLKWSE